MAFYEMLPGSGMPAGLQAGMDSVLNKKFGTSTTYPAEGWPDNVNLLGPLPEKTVSGAIVTFADGADAVPLKKCEITLPASLDGYSEIDVIHTGKNLWDEEWEEGLISASDGQNTPSDQYSRTKNYITVKPSISVYLFLGVARIYIRRYGKDKGYLGYAQINTSSVWNVPNDTYFIRFCWDGTTYTDNISVNYPSTETTYHQAKNPTTHTASLGRTIYGGSVDVAKGQGESTHGLYTFTGNEVYVQQKNQVAVKVAFTVGSSYQTGLDTAISAVEDFVAGGCGASNYLYVKTAMTAEDLKTYMANHTVNFAYVLASFEDFTFDPVPIDSKLGNNTIWSEQGSSAEVTYRADINLALGGN